MVPNSHLSRAVLTGVAHYRNLSELTAVANNLPALAEELRSDRAWGLPSGHCAVVEDPVAVADLLDPVVEAAQEATDTFLFYYAGHGLVDPRRGELHLALVGSDPQRMYTAVPYALVRDALLDSRAARRIVILDCCYSGRALGQMANPASAVVDEASAEGTYVLAAAAENRTALAPPGEQYTAFTGELLDIIRRGITGGRPLLDLDSIYRQLLAVMKAKGLPFPQKRDRNTAGQLTLLRNQAFQRSAKDFGISGPGQLRERLGPILPSAAGVQGIEPTTGVMPESLGIETKGGIFTRIIERGTPVPTKRSEIFTTAEDSQSSVQIKVFRGDYETAAHNMSLGVFEISGIPPAPRGVPQIEVTFHVDIYGVFKISAKDRSTGRIVNVQLKAGLGLCTAGLRANPTAFSVTCLPISAGVRGSSRAFRAWPLAWPSPSGPLGRQRSPALKGGSRRSFLRSG